MHAPLPFDARLWLRFAAASGRTLVLRSIRWPHVCAGDDELTPDGSAIAPPLSSTPEERGESESTHSAAHKEQRMDTMTTNPATGLPMTSGGVDVGGNPFGAGSYQHPWSSPTPTPWWNDDDD